MDKLIYMDNAATTSTAPEVVSAMLPFFTEYYGNPSSVYNFAQKSKMAIEVGTIEPVREIGEIAHKHGILFHTDAVQAMCHVPINVTEMNIDLLSASAHKFHGPKGVGFMYMKNTAKLEPFIHGGAQERARRA